MGTIYVYFRDLNETLDETCGKIPYIFQSSDSYALKIDK